LPENGAPKNHPRRRSAPIETARLRPGTGKSFMTLAITGGVSTPAAAAPHQVRDEAWPRVGVPGASSPGFQDISVIVFGSEASGRLSRMRGVFRRAAAVTSRPVRTTIRWALNRENSDLTAT
jgi:hypothetical protein